MITAAARVAVVNESTLVSDAEVLAWVPSLQYQVREHFAPLWGVDAVVFYLQAGSVQPFHWVLGVFDNADQAGALGYHDLTSAGKPVMKIFAQDTAAAGVVLSTVASHELLETLADPFIESLTLNLPAGAPAGEGTLYMQEIADPVEGDSYSIWDIEVSNFVTPWWFGSDTIPPGAKYDYLGKLTAPLTMTPGGYFGYAKILPGVGVEPWAQSFADERSKVLATLSRAHRKINKL